MDTHQTKYEFYLPKKNSDKLRHKFYTIEELVNSYTGMRIKDSFGDNFEIIIYNWQSTIKNFSVVMGVMETIFEKDNLEITNIELRKLN